MKHKVIFKQKRILTPDLIKGDSYYIVYAKNPINNYIDLPSGTFKQIEDNIFKMVLEHDLTINEEAIKAHGFTSYLHLFVLLILHKNL